MRARLVGMVVAILVVASTSEAKTFRYASGPKPPADTLGWVAESELQPILGRNHAKVPLTNLQLVNLVADTAFAKVLKGAPLDSSARVVLAPAESHPLNFVVEHAILRQLARRGVTATVRRTLIPDDSLRAVSAENDPVLEYQLATARVTYLRLIGYLRVKIERQTLVEGGVTLRDPATARVIWVGDAGYNVVDRFPRGETALVEDERFAELKSEVPSRNAGKFLEPLVVVAVVSGLVALFFQNRP